MSQHVRRATLAALLVASVAFTAPQAGAGVAQCARPTAGELPSTGEGLDVRPAGNYAVDQGHAIVASGACAYRTGALCALGLASDVVNEQLDPSFATEYAACTTGLATGQ